MCNELYYEICHETLINVFNVSYSLFYRNFYVLNWSIQYYYATLSGFVMSIFCACKIHGDLLFRT